MRVYNTKEVAKMTNRSGIGIRKIAARYAEIGAKVGRDWVFTDEDVKNIMMLDRRGGRGRDLSHQQGTTGKELPGSEDSHNDRPEPAPESA
jgi:hypothetical protein